MLTFCVFGVFSLLCFQLSLLVHLLACKELSLKWSVMWWARRKSVLMHSFDSKRTWIGSLPTPSSISSASFLTINSKIFVTYEISSLCRWQIILGKKRPGLAATYPGVNCQSAKTPINAFVLSAVFFITLSLCCFLKTSTKGTTDPEGGAI